VLALAPSLLSLPMGLNSIVKHLVINSPDPGSVGKAELVNLVAENPQIQDITVAVGVVNRESTNTETDDITRSLRLGARAIIHRNASTVWVETPPRAREEEEKEEKEQLLPPPSRIRVTSLQDAETARDSLNKVVINLSGSKSRLSKPRAVIETHNTQRALTILPSVNGNYYFPNDSPNTANSTAAPPPVQNEYDTPGYQDIDIDEIDWPNTAQVGRWSEAYKNERNKEIEAEEASFEALKEGRNLIDDPLDEDSRETSPKLALVPPPTPEAQLIRGRINRSFRAATPLMTEICRVLNALELSLQRKGTLLANRIEKIAIKCKTVQTSSKTPGEPLDPHNSKRTILPQLLPSLSRKITEENLDEMPSGVEVLIGIIITVKNNTAQTIWEHGNTSSTIAKLLLDGDEGDLEIPEVFDERPIQDQILEILANMGIKTIIQSNQIGIRLTVDNTHKALMKNLIELAAFLEEKVPAVRLKVA
jgi:hypothetical protein